VAQPPLRAGRFNPRAAMAKPKYFAMVAAVVMFGGEALGYGEVCNIFVFSMAVVMYTAQWMFRQWLATRA
jgi:hypothetical protein